MVSHELDVEARLRQFRDSCVCDSLRPLAVTISIVYLALAAMLAVGDWEDWSGPLALLAAATGTACLFTWQVLGDRSISLRHAHPVAAGLIGLLLVNLLMQLHLVRVAANITSIAIVTVAVGCLLLSWAWLAGVLVVVNVLTVPVAMMQPESVDSFEFLMIQSSATGLSVCIFAMRFRTLTRVELSRIREQRHKIELETALGKVRQNEARFRMLSESVPVGIFQVDEKGFCTYANTMWQDIVGWSPLMESRVPWHQALHVDERKQAVEDWDAGRASGLGLHGVYRLNDDGRGGKRWAELHLNAVAADSGTCYVGALDDITERKDAEEALTKYADDLRRAKELQERNTVRLAHVVEELEVAKRKAEESTRSKSEFLANMSHEIRTPMTAILGYTDLLLERAQHDQEAFSFLETIKRNGIHLLQVINDILDISTVEAGKLKIARVRCSPAEIVRDVRSSMHVRALEKKLPLIVRFEGPIPETILTDPTRLRQILINLVANAIKFTGSGSVEIVTRLVGGGDRAGQSATAPTGEACGSEADKARLEFDVVDTGIGLGPDQLARLFEPFTQGDSSTSRQFSGTGLGLSISKRLADMLEGTIEVESQLGRGSRFRVTLPAGPLAGVRLIERLDDERPASKPPAAAPAPPKAEKLPPGCRILLAEDGPDNQRLISYLLRCAGAEVTLAENGRIACDLALATMEAGKPFDVVLMDMQMPVLDGYAATRCLRAAGYEGSIVALTAHTMRRDREQCLAAGCDDYAAKPINRDVLFDVIRKYVGRAGDDAAAHGPQPVNRA
jgi:PAS domain S-box-containing protein